MPHVTRRSVLAGVGLAAAGGTVLHRPGESRTPTFDPSVSQGAWPMAGRGPARTAHAPAANPPTSGARVVWATTLELGFENLTIAVDDRTVYVPAHDALVALDRRDGSVRWRFETTRRWSPGGLELEVGPVVTGGQVLVGSRRAVIAVDAETGDVLWHRATESSRSLWAPVGRSVVVPDGGTAVDDGISVLDARTGLRTAHWETDTVLFPVAFVDGAVLAVGDDVVAAFDPRTGRRRWRSQGTIGGTLDSAQLVAATPEAVVVGSNPLVALDPADGTELWRHRLPKPDDFLQQFQPVTDGERVYVAAWEAGATLALDVTTGEVVWRAPGVLGDLVVARQRLYCFEQSVTTLEAATGRRIGRLERTFARPNEDGTLAAVGDRLYVAVAPNEGRAPDRPTVYTLEAP